MKVTATKAFDIYCDRVIKDATDLYNQRNDQNKVLEKAKKQLGSVKLIYNGGGGGDGDNDENTSNEMTCEIPLEDFVVDDNVEEEEEEEEEATTDDNMGIGQVQITYSNFGPGFGDGEDDDNSNNNDNNTEYVVYDFSSNTQPLFSFPYSKIRKLALNICGIPQSKFPLCQTKFKIKDNDQQIIEVEYGPWGEQHPSKIVATFTGYSGTYEDVKFLIESNQISMHFLGNAFGGLAMSQFDFSSLDNAICTITKLKIPKTDDIDTTIRCLMKGNTGNHKKIANENDEIVWNHLALLKCVDPRNDKIRTIANKLKQTLQHHAYLKSCHDMFQSVHVTYPGQVNVLHTNLANCTIEETAGERSIRSERNHNEEEQQQQRQEEEELQPPSSWTISRPEGLSLMSSWKIPVTSIVKLQFKFANIPANTPGRALFIQQPIWDNRHNLILKYSSPITAVFMFNETLFDGIDPDGDDHYPGGPLRYVQEALMGINRPGVVIPEAYQKLTMTLVWIQIRMDTIQSYLDALGIDTSAAPRNTAA